MVRAISPEKKFKFKMSVEAILMHFETMFACELWLIVQAFHVAVHLAKFLTLPVAFSIYLRNDCLKFFET